MLLQRECARPLLALLFDSSHDSTSNGIVIRWHLKVIHSDEGKVREREREKREGKKREERKRGKGTKKSLVRK